PFASLCGRSGGARPTHGRRSTASAAPRRGNLLPPLACAIQGAAQRPSTVAGNLGGKSMTGAKVFVAVIYVVLGVAFLASSGLLIGEFRADDWFAIVVAHSHLFFFFAVFGILALAAFYLPSVVFTHLYWSHLPYGRLRYGLGLIAAAALSAAVGWWLDAKPRAIWEVSPRALAADKGETVACGASGSTCRRAPILDVLASLREEAQHRVGLSKFAR